MIKNASGQHVGAQLVDAEDGSAVTSGTTTVFVTGDAGTQATGSVGSGAATHEGNGFWTYAPAQAETDFDHVAFTFVNSSAVSATVQTYPQAAPLTASAIASEVWSETTRTLTAFGFAVETDSASRTASQADVSALALEATVQALNDLGAADVRSAIGLASANLDTQLSGLDTDVGAVQSAVDGLNDLAASDVADAVWDEAKAGHVASGSFGEEVQAHALSTEIAALNDFDPETLDPTALQQIVDDLENGGRLDLLIDAIKAKTDSLTFTQSGQVDSNVRRINSVTLTGNGTSGTEWGPA